MKALSLTQPWAMLCWLLHKRLETRGWHTAYRGPLAIHASETKTKHARAVAERDPIIAPLLEAAGYTFDTLPRGGIGAVCELTNTFEFIDPSKEKELFQRPRTLDPATLSEVERACGDFRPGRKGLALENMRRLPDLVMCKGALSLWTVPDHLLASLI